MNTEWEYHPSLVSMEKDTFDDLLNELQALCATYTFRMYDKEITSARASCVFRDSERTNHINPRVSYDNIPSYDWSELPGGISAIRDQLEKQFSLRFDYVLVHIYRDGKDHIGFHNDKEALNSDIVSVSLGATRRFRFRPINATKGYTHEYILRHGDVIHMKGPDPSSGRPQGCQQLYKHEVPAMSVADLLSHINENGLKPPVGRKTHKILKEYTETNKIVPSRINLTFRQYDH